MYSTKIVGNLVCSCGRRTHTVSVHSDGYELRQCQKCKALLRVSSIDKECEGCASFWECLSSKVMVKKCEGYQKE